jgi:transposase
MGFREVTMEEIREVLLLWLEGVPKKRIARQLRMGPPTVRRYIAAAEAVGLTASSGKNALTDERFAGIAAQLRSAGGRPRGDGWALCVEHRGEIERLVGQQLRLSKVRRLLLRTGVDVPYATLHRFAVRELGFGRRAATIPVDDCGPGEELQVDTGWIGLLEPDLFGKRRRLRAWIFTAVRSRHRFVWPCFEETTKSAIEACEAAWDFFGGVFRVLIPDNTKAIVIEADKLGARVTQAFLEYAQARGFHVDAARARRPQDKGRVERSVQTVRDDCFAGERLTSLEDALRRARTWCLDEYGMRRHTRTQRRPLEHFEAEEKPALLAPPSQTYDVPLWADPKVGRDQHAQVARALYSLPRQHIGQTLRARADAKLVRFYAGATLVKTHARQPPGGRSTDPNDFEPETAATARRDVDFFVRKAKSHGEAIGGFAQAVLAGPLPWTRMRQVYALLGLVQRYGAARVESECARALAAEMADVRRLERMVKLALPPEPPRPPSNVIPLARYLRPASQYALPLASRARSTEGEEKQ